MRREGLPARKSLRLKNYDYSLAGAYFITICVKERRELLGTFVGGGFHAAPTVQLSNMGNEIANAIDYINQNYAGVMVDKYVIMPNHIHLIVILTGGHGSPPLHKVMGLFKSFTTKQWNEISGTQRLELWQRSYHDHIIRSEGDYGRIWQYIDENPARWQEDPYFTQS